ncbi:hypothetical protein A2U01_0092716, partial [Trifolium medium]|nr:hypothetical protein [Trifolium medium]
EVQRPIDEQYHSTMNETLQQGSSDLNLMVNSDDDKDPQKTVPGQRQI